MVAVAVGVTLSVMSFQAPGPRVNEEGECEHVHPAGHPSVIVMADAPHGELSAFVTLTEYDLSSPAPPDWEAGVTLTVGLPRRQGVDTT